MGRSLRWLMVAAMALVAVTAAADQHAWVSLESAQRALAMIPEQGLVRHLCQPCGDTTWQEERVTSVAVQPTASDGWHQVVINGNGVDLAYLYVETDGGWRNLAILLGLDVSDVSAVLPDSGAAEPSAATSDPCERPETTADALVCVQAELEAADAELNQVYQELMRTLTEPRRSRLRDAQRAWIPFRDACAEFEAGLFEGGSMAEVIRISELAHRTRKRTEELRGVLDLGE